MMRGLWRRVTAPGWPRWAWALFVAAVAVRLVYLAQGYPVPAQDTPDYDEIALNLLAGHGFVASEHWFGFELRAWRPPFYPFFLAAVYAVAGYSHLAVKVVQSFVGAATAVLVYLLARRVRPAAAPIAGVLAVVYGPLVSSASEVMTEVWFTCWLVLAAWLLHDGVAAAFVRRRRLLVGGIVIGLAALTRPVGLLLWPAFALPAACRQGLEGARRAAWVGVAVVAVLLPWSLRNHQLLGAWVPLSSQGGFILARSNSARPAWREQDGWGIEEALFHQIPSEVERDRYWRQQGIDYIRSHPGQYLRLAGERFLRFWYFLRPDYNFWFMLVLPLFAAGLWQYRGHADLSLLRWIMAVQVAVFSLVLYGSTRFRLPLEPLFLVYAAAWGRDRWEQWGARRAALIGSALVAVNLVAAWGSEPLRAWLLALLDGFELR